MNEMEFVESIEGEVAGGEDILTTITTRDGGVIVVGGDIITVSKDLASWKESEYLLYHETDTTPATPEEAEGNPDRAHVKDAYTEHTGGQVMVDYVVLRSGLVLGINDDCVLLHSSLEALQRGEKEIAVAYWEDSDG